MTFDRFWNEIPIVGFAPMLVIGVLSTLEAKRTPIALLNVRYGGKRTLACVPIGRESLVAKVPILDGTRACSEQRKAQVLTFPRHGRVAVVSRSLEAQSVAGPALAIQAVV